MHARNRSSPGNGYRSNSMLIGGVGTPSHISPESSARGRGGYNSEYRSYNRGGYGRGPSRQFHRSQPPQPKGGDIFVEAGRLATEYLVAKGLMPANVLSGKWQNDSLKSHVGAQEGDGMQLPMEGRTSALSRLGSSVSDIGPGRRRYPDDFNFMDSRNYMRGRRRNGSFKNYSSDWSREFGRSGSWSERSRISADADVENDAFSRHPDEQQVSSNDADSVSQNSLLELAPESDVGGDSESALEKHKSGDNGSAKGSSSNSEKDLSMEANVESLEKADIMKISHEEVGEIKDGKDSEGIEQQDFKDERAVTAGAEVNTVATENRADLLKLCSFVKIPTKTRSSMAIRSSKVDNGPMLVDESTCQVEPSKESGSHAEDLAGDSSLEKDSSKYTNDSKSLDLDNSKVPTAKVDLGITYNIGQGIFTTSISYPDKSSVNEQDTDEELTEFGRANSIVEQGEKRAINDENTIKANKKPRESEDPQSDGCLRLSDSLEKQQQLQEVMTSHGEGVILPSDEKGLLDISLYPKGDIEPCMEFAEEKQLFPGSFKTCDLNLMEVSDVNENHDRDPILIFPSITESGKQPIPVDVDLSISNNSHAANRFGKCSIDGKDIEVIDLENDSAQEDKGFTNSERRTENVFTGLDGFPNNAHNGNDIPDAQDGYGLMISELLGNDMPNCSSVPADMNSLHNDMGLHNGEGMLGDDDSIYMSLGEIPISFLRGWEQPTQEYGKPF